MKKFYLVTLSLFCLLLLQNQTGFAQQPDRQPTLAEIAQEGTDPDFFVIKSELNLTKEAFIESYLPVLNLTPGSTMQFLREETDEIGITHSRYQQYWNGRRVLGGEMVIHQQKGRIKYINGRYMQALPLNTQVVVNEQTGLQTALQQINSTKYNWLDPEAEANYKKVKKNPNATLYPHGELVFIPERGNQRKLNFMLVWKFAINVTPATESYEVYINATTGEVLNKLPIVLSCSGGTSTTIWNGAQTIYTQLNAGTYRSLGDCNSAQIQTLNGNGNDNGVGATYYTDADNAWPNTALGNYIAQTHWGVKETRDYYAAVHGREGYDDAGHEYVSYINGGFTSNAYWNPTTEAASFGGTSTGGSPYCNIDVCGHEHTHGVVAFTSNLVYQDEPGALNESFADCIGEAVEVRTLGTTNWIHRFEISGGNRSLINPNAFGDPDTYLGTNWYTGTGDYGGVHTNSGVQNYWFYLLSVGASGTNDLGNAFTVSGIGINKARLIAYQTLISLTTNSQYADARSVSIQAAKDLYGNCSDEAEQTTRAWYAVGVGANWVTPASIAITATASPADICQGASTTLTAFGASTYDWNPGPVGNPYVASPSASTIYTVTGTDAEQCTGTKTIRVFVTELPSASPTATDDDLCFGQSTLLSAGLNQTLNTLTTELIGTNGVSANVFDITALNSITITDFTMNIISGANAEVWYKSGGYGNANVTSTAGWTKLGATVPITPLGAGLETLIPTTVNLTIPAGQTYGIMIACDGSNRYSNGTVVGATAASSGDMIIKQGHGGTGFGGTFSLTNSPRVFNGSVIYRSNLTSYSWTPTGSLSTTTSSSTTATPPYTTTYTVQVTDGNGCTGTGTRTVYVNDGPNITSITASPSTICVGQSSQLNVTASSTEVGTLSTPLNANNGFAGNVFDVIADKNITLTGFKMVIESGTQAQVWYKAGSYGNAALNSSAGWTQLGSTVAITAQGAGVLTTIPVTASLSIPAGQTYGIVVVCDGVNDYTNGTAVGNIISSNPDLSITEGHGGSGFGGTFAFSNGPRVFNGQLTYTVDNTIASYSWSPSLSAVSNPTASPVSSTSYVVTVTDGDGCTNTAMKRVNVGNKPQPTITASPSAICPGSNSTLSVTNSLSQADALFTTLLNNNGNGGNVFDITTTNAITITSLKMNIDTGATQAEVYYNPGGYGGANVTSTAGWTKLGATVNITPAGEGALTNIPITTSLSIPAGQTYGLVVVADGGVNYNNGTLVGAVYASNPDFSIKEGHGGTGFGGVFNFINSPRVWNGQIDYTTTHDLTGYAWTPATNINNTSSATPIVNPPTSTAYSVTVTDDWGCTATGSIGLEVMNTPLGSATASPTSSCQGANITLTYNAPTGPQCHGVQQSGFAGSYAPATWSTVLTNSNGTVNTAGAPANIIMTSSNGLAGSGTTGYQHTMPCSGFVNFNWSYSTVDAGPQYDYPRYSVNGGSAVIFAGFAAQSGYPKTQAGTFSVYLNGGDVLQLQMQSSDNIGGAGTLTITNFRATYQTTSAQTLAWYSVPTGGSSMASLNPYTFPSTTSGSLTYYAQVTATGTGCTNSTRAATNTIVVNPTPVITASAAQPAICSTASTTLTATGANTYSWQPGGMTGSNVSVAPTTTTTYTVTGTSAAGCTATATVMVTVNPLPVISGSASPGIVCPGGAVTLTGTTAGVTWNWQPGNLNGSPVVVNPIVQTTYTVTATSAQGCTKTQTFVILMHPVPTVSTSVSPSATICNGQTATITATGGVSYLWQPGATTGATRNVTTSGTYTVTATNAQGCTATATRTITVNPLPTVTTSATSTTICNGSSTTLSATGASTYTWQPGGLSGSSVVVSPTTTTTYTVTGTSAAGCTNTATRQIIVNTCGNGVLTVKAYNQGYYVGSGLMASVLMNQGQPGGASDCDTVEVRLHQSTAPYGTVQLVRGLMPVNGTMVCTFPPAVVGNNYYISLRHRNSIETWSANPVTMTTALTYDFTTAANKAYGNNQILIDGSIPNRYAVYNGDVNQDGVVDGLDYNDWESDNNNFASGYFSTDFNGDGIVDGLDFLIWEVNNNNFVGMITP